MVYLIPSKQKNRHRTIKPSVRSLATRYYTILYYTIPYRNTHVVKTERELTSAFALRWSHQHVDQLKCKTDGCIGMIKEIRRD